MAEDHHESMTQECLNHAAICAMYDDAVLVPNQEELVAEFVSRTVECGEIIKTYKMSSTLLNAHMILSGI